MALRQKSRNFEIPSLRGFEKRGSNLYKNPPTCVFCVIPQLEPSISLSVIPRLDRVISVLGNLEFSKIRHCERSEAISFIKPY